MFADPITFTVNGVAKTLNRISQGDLTATYAAADDEYRLMITHQVTKANRVRSVVEVIQKKVVTDPLTSVNDYDTVLLRMLFDRPEVGWTATELNYVNAALAAFLSSTNVGKLYGKES